MAKRVIVVGGGISGLAAARAAVETAADAGEGLEVVVYEREACVGGKAQTRRQNGWLTESGPAGYLDDADSAEIMRRLVDAAGLRGDLRTASDAARRRYVVRSGRAREVRPNPIRLVTSGILSLGGAMRLIAEPFVPPARSLHDESVFDFAARRIGKEAAERLVAPMMLGIFAGDARQLSLRSGFPRLAQLEREHGSLVRGMLRRRGARTGGPSGPAGVLTSFRDGIQSLPLQLAARGGFTIRTATAVNSLDRDDTGDWHIRAAGCDGDAHADAVVLASEAWSTARLVAPHAPSSADALAAIFHPPVLAVSLGYPADAAHHFPYGFGCLIPRTEPLRSLGCVWDSALFDGRAPSECVLVRVLLGGTVDPDAAKLTDEAAVSLAVTELRQLFGVHADPIHVRVARWARAIPQYAVGHGDAVAAIEQDVSRLPGLFLAGNALHGIAFAKAAAAGWREGAAAARYALARSSVPHSGDEGRRRAATGTTR